MSDQGEGAAKSRRALPITLVIVASLIGLLSIFAIWAKRQLLETDTWVETSTELIQNAEVKAALSDFLVNELYANVDVQAELAAQLPEPVKPLAGPVSGGLRQLAGEVSLKALESSQVEDLWATANRAAHEQFLSIIDDEGEAVSTANGTVTLELGAILDQIVSQLGLPEDLASKLPPEAASLEVMQADQLETAQSLVKLMRTLAWLLLAISLLLYGVAIYLAGERRRETLRAAGISFILIGALVLVAHRAGGDAIVSSLSDVASADDAVSATWTIGTSQLTEIANAAILYGVFIVISAWFAGPTRLATSIRYAVAPWYRQPRFAYSALAGLLILLFWWDPTQGTHRLAPSLLLIVLLVIGSEFLRRQIVREFPDRVTTGSSEGVAQSLAARMREARENVVSKRGTESGSPAADDARIAELERLAKLRDSGVLSEDEFATEKQRVLAKTS